MSNNLHLIPPNVLDIVENLSTTKHENAVLSYIARLEAIRDYCDSALKKHQMHKASNPWNPANYKRKSR
jgi:hypothetical protein